MAANTSSVTPDTLITIKITINESTKKLKLPLRDLTCTTLPAKLRSCLSIAPDHISIFERYSDSVGGYITLDPSNVAVFKALNRAAKAKGKLRLKATIIPPEVQQETVQATAPEVVPVPQIMLPQTQNIGTGIFQYRDTRAMMKRSAEAPVPLPFTASIANVTREDTMKARQGLAFRPREPAACAPTKFCAWSVYCNSCDVAMDDAHFHCSICDNGDYDLCEACVTAGKSCPGEDHWLIKRFIQDGKVVTSSTERVPRRSVELEAKMPGAFQQEEIKVLTPPTITRTCNSCVRISPENEFVTCKSCEDFDLCFQCHAADTAGHHPAHEFQAAVAGAYVPQNNVALLKAGRGIEHNAYCDGCDQKIYGVRHKCLSCPDWDYCSDCVKKAPATHAKHRFAALYEPLREPRSNYVRHEGIFCDGPLCSKKNNQSYIVGVRYKCAVCHDTDFCAACEALPGNRHNKTHPLIKFSTPVRNASITTVNEDPRGNVRNLGDKRPEPVKTEPVAPAPVQTVADIAPTDEKYMEKSAQPFDGDVSTARGRTIVPAAMLNADFVRDTIADGTVMYPGMRFVQVWTLRNTGPFSWPAGCSVKYVGGDNMLDVENGRPSSIATINQAVESSVCGREVLPGEEIAFSITLKAPLREGKSISYWRLKSLDGTPFGHRLWCDIDVRSVPKTQELPQPPFLQAVDWNNLALPARPRPAQYIGDCSRTSRRAVPLPQPPSAPVWSPQESSRPIDAQARARMEALKTRIMQSRAAVLQRRLVGNQTHHIPITSVVKDEPAIKIEPVEQKAAVVPAVTEAEVEETAASTSSSQMIFPKLEKESPASSMADIKSRVATVENEDGEIEDAAVPQSPVTELEPTSAEQLDDFDDIEVLSISAHSDDDGFLTDEEEYDILAASDCETEPVGSP